LEAGAHADVVEIDARIAECHLYLGEAQEAVALLQDALSRASATGGGSPQIPLLYRELGGALMQLGRGEEAERALQESLKDARSRRAVYEGALTLLALATLKAQREEPFPEEAEARQILEGLGVI